MGEKLMGKYTRWAPLLVEAMSDEIREKFFFGEPDEDIDAGWDLFEATYPDQAEILYEFLTPHLEGVKKEFIYLREYNRLLSLGEKGSLAAARLKIHHEASKINF